MNYPKEMKLFTIHEVCNACGISRTTLIRMEESGFLKPFKVDQETGYRYYNAQNISAIGQYQRMQNIGLSRKEITDVYYEKVDSRKFIEEQKIKINRIRRFLNEYELRHDHSKNFTCSFLTLPAISCYCETISTGPSLEDTATQCYVVFERCIEKGYKMLGSEPLMGIYEGFDALNNPNSEPKDFLYCIPIIPGPEKDENVRYFPETEAFSIIGFGSFSAISELSAALVYEFRSRGLEAAGPVRVIALVAPYTGTHFKADDYCYECVVPIKSRK